MSTSYPPTRQSSGDRSFGVDLSLGIDGVRLGQLKRHKHIRLTYCMKLQSWHIHRPAQSFHTANLSLSPACVMCERGARREGTCSIDDAGCGVEKLVLVSVSTEIKSFSLLSSASAGTSAKRVRRRAFYTLSPPSCYSRLNLLVVSPSCVTCTHHPSHPRPYAMLNAQNHLRRQRAVQPTLIS